MQKGSFHGDVAACIGSVHSIYPSLDATIRRWQDAGIHEAVKAIRFKRSVIEYIVAKNFKGLSTETQMRLKAQLIAQRVEQIREIIAAAHSQLVKPFEEIGGGGPGYVVVHEDKDTQDIFDSIRAGCAILTTDYI